VPEYLNFADPVIQRPDAPDGVRVFDWHQAVDLIKEHNIQNAEAGLVEDWGYTSGVMLRDGEPETETYCYLLSRWATPTLLDLDTADEYPCFMYKDQAEPLGWDEATIWPEGALLKLKGESE